jgi:transposase-like protein
MGIIKAGFSRKGVQRYKNTETGKVTLEKSSRPPIGIKLLATFLYMNGLSARIVGDIVSIHNTSVLKYVKEFSDFLVVKYL